MTCLFIPRGTTLNTSDGIRKESRLVAGATSIRKLNRIYRTLKLSWRCLKVHALSKLALYTFKIRFMNFEQKRMVNFGPSMDRLYVQRYVHLLNLTFLLLVVSGILQLGV
jgi:hypothetical protein